MSNPPKVKGTRHSHFKGLEAEAAFIGFAARQGWPLYRGLDGHEPCDYVVDIDGDLQRVEVKGAFSHQKNSSSRNGHEYVTITKVKSKNFDHLFLLTPEGEYWIPGDEVGQTLSIGTAEHRQRPSKYEMYRVDAGVRKGGTP